MNTGEIHEVAFEHLCSSPQESQIIFRSDGTQFPGNVPWGHERGVDPTGQGEQFLVGHLRFHDRFPHVPVKPVPRLILQPIVL